MPNSSRIMNGPSKRLSTSLGWRRTSLTSLLKNDSRRMIGLNIIVVRLLHQSNKHVVKWRHILVGLLHVYLGMLLDHVEDLRQAVAGVIDIDIQQPWLLGRAPHVLDDVLALDNFGDIIGLRGIDDQLNNLAAKCPAPQVIGRVDMNHPPGEIGRASC